MEAEKGRELKSLMLTNQYLHRILDIKSVAHFSIDFRGLIFKPTFQQTGNHTAVSKQNM